MSIFVANGPRVTDPRSHAAGSDEVTDMRTHSRRTWPLFLAVAVLVLLGAFVFHGVVAVVLEIVAFVGVLAAAIYALTGEKVQDGAGGIAGGTGF